MSLKTPLSKGKGDFKHFLLKHVAKKTLAPPTECVKNSSPPPDGGGVEKKPAPP